LPAVGELRKRWQIPGVAFSRSFSVALRLRSFANLPCFGSACHGGIVPSPTSSRIALAHFRASAYDSRDIGAISPGRWQVAQFS
jgi:hypothetical protein